METIDVLYVTWTGGSCSVRSVLVALSVVTRMVGVRKDAPNARKVWERMLTWIT